MIVLEAIDKVETESNELGTGIRAALDICGVAQKFSNQAFVEEFVESMG